MGIVQGIGDLTAQMYERVLMEQIKSDKVPHHIGIITDGNRRYAKNNNISDEEGHVQGKKKLEEVLEWCMEIGVHTVTVYGFSTENFNRNPDEVDFLLRLINGALLDLMKDQRVFKNRIRVKVIGDPNRLPDYLRKTIDEVERTTEDFEKFRLNIAVGYGGREEIISAIKSIVKDVEDKKIQVDDINEGIFRKYLYDKTSPDPDLILRTSGEERISNFLLWQSAYSELYFSEVNWPELRKVDFLKAIASYQQRKRRFGK
ncbi:MAG: polyprenyl diphosphate synthase [Thermoplasmatales archaeon]|nr:polyprenyl diphosphate synthase [Thermoplasmatales archaeon]MCW6169867.1 polyprenyl diphosphate synthase [Thermoplasmatales archaeon]